MPLLSEIEYGALLQYAVRDDSDLARQSRRVRDAIKFRADPQHLARSAEIIGGNTNTAVHRLVAPLFGPDVALVPVPGHTPQFVQDSLSVPLEICRALHRAGLAADVLPCLQRTALVQKSATAPRGRKRDAQTHYDTVAASGLALTAPRRLLVVDDFITSGATMLACVSRLHEAYPEARVSAFALVRSISDGPIGAVLSPCVGTVRLQADGRTQRHP